MRDGYGRFVPGAPGGPGRPRRAVEREYLAVLSEVCPLDTWRAVCERAVSDAQSGDAKAREWLARYVMGATPRTLTELAEAEALDVSPDIEVGAAAYARYAHANRAVFLDSTPSELAVHLAVVVPTREAAAREAEAEAERRREAAAARKAARLAAASEVSSGPAVEPVPGGDVGGVA